MKTKHLLCLAVAWSAVISTACGKSSVIPVTPKNTNEMSQFKFAVTNNTVSNEVSFQVIITAKHDALPTGCKGYLCAAKLTGRNTFIGPMTSKTQVTLKTGKRSLIADFIASPQLLGNPDACFVFVIHHRGPSADFYVLKLRDFATRCP